MNIIGEGVDSRIANQVTQRQKVYGSGFSSNRTLEEISFLNSNTSWCKLVSSVNVSSLRSLNNESIRTLGLTGNELAKKFVLFNGTEDTNSRSELNSGINFEPKNLAGSGYAYGIGGDEFGLRPMMGIQSAEIKHLNRGSIRRATIKIKAWNKIQFDIIDVLYLRLGFSTLLEWGHSMFYLNDGSFQSNNFGSLSDQFLRGGNSYEGFLRNIQSQRRATNGNYDAMFGKVVNYHWSFQKDGSYDIELELISLGDVVESFKINVLKNGTAPISPFVAEDGSVIPVEELNDQQILTLWQAQNSIAEWFYSLTVGNFELIVADELEEARERFAVEDTIQDQLDRSGVKTPEQIEFELRGGFQSNEELDRLTQEFFSD